MRAFNEGLTILSYGVVTLIAFVIIILKNPEEFTPALAFTILSLINLLGMPFRLMIFGLMNMKSALNAGEKVKSILGAEENIP